MDAIAQHEPVDQNAAVLTGANAYQKYYELQDRAFRLQLECLKVRTKGMTQDADSFEATMLANMLERLRYTTAVLRMKFAFPESDMARGNLRVDLTESGFPIHHNLTSLDVDLVDKETMLADLPAAKALQNEILRHMLEKGEVPQSLLATRTKREYLEMLDESKLFLPFTMGPLVSWSGKRVSEGCRRYLCGWGCFDQTRNIPFAHFMVFEQDESEQPFEEGGDNLAKFLKVLRLEGSMAPEKLNDLATGIDRALDPIHPKLIKRVRIGPLFTPLLIQERPEAERTEVESTMLDVFTRADCKDGFALCWNEELTSSVNQKTERGLLSRVKREVFLMPQLEEQEEEAPKVYRYILMPHRVYQVIQAEDIEKLPRFNERTRFGYDEKERIHEIG